MDIYHAINTTIQFPPRSLADAQNLLSQYSPQVQAQLIAAIYIGRDHLNHAELQEGDDWTCRATEHIPPADYAQILFDKASSDVTTNYLNALLRCSNASGYNLNQM